MCIYIYINYNNRSKNGVEELVQMDLGAQPEMEYILLDQLLNSIL